MIIVWRLTITDYRLMAIIGDYRQLLAIIDDYWRLLAIIND